MTEKITSADVYENVRGNLRDKEPFDRTDVEIVLERAHHATNNTMPSAKSFLDWARREGHVETVKRGFYRWVQTAESEAADIGRQIAREEQQETVPVTDSDPEHPMILDHDDRSMDDPDDSLPEGFAAVEIFYATKRLPRKVKKQAKAHFLANPGIRKVTMRFDKSTNDAWEATR